MNNETNNTITEEEKLEILEYEHLAKSLTENWNEIQMQISNNEIIRKNGHPATE